MLRFALVCGALLGLMAGGTCVAQAAERAKSVSIGDQVPDFKFKDLRYLPRTLSEFGDKKAFVIVFTSLDCPLVNRYLPRLGEMEREYRERGVQFVAMNVGPADDITEVAYQAIKHNCEFPFCKDFDYKSVDLLGVDRTPEVCVLDGKRVLKYRGRIDSQYRLGGVSPTNRRDDLKLAIEDVLAGRDVEVSTTAVDGCKISRPVLWAPDNVNYGEHVAAIIKQHCQECHRQNTTAPFTLLTYDEVKDMGEMISEVVREQRMPPCFASSEQTEIVNRKVMSKLERDTVVAWVNSGMPAGDLSLAPEPMEPQPSEWEIGTPDLIVEMPKPIKIPADGLVAYKYVILPHTFKEDTWVQKIEIMPGNREVVHHLNMAALVGSKVSDAQFITGYVPGGEAMMLDPHQAFRIPKGARLVLQIHYVTTGTETSDQTKVGFVYPKERVQKEIQHFRVTTGKFEIAPFAPHYPVEAVRELPGDATGIGMFSHMHLRGKDMLFEALYPNGDKEVILAIPNYSFDWQMNYRWAPNTKHFPQGTKIRCIAHYDNSPFNPYNPDPSATVREGDQTHEEMMFGFFFYTLNDEQLDLEIDPATGYVVHQEASPEQQVAK